MFTIVENGLHSDVYHSLRAKVNFKEYQEADVALALQHTLYSLVVYDQDKAVGIARLVGDNRICFFLKDVVVDPAYQKLKVGKLLMEYIFMYLEKNACEGAYVGLMSTPQCIPFYEHFGFQQRPCEGMGPGMIQFYHRKECD